MLQIKNSLRENRTHLDKKFFLFFVLFFFPLFFINGQTSDNPISLSLSPESPGINKEVVVTLQSESVDLGLSNIKWTLNGSVRLVGVGERRARFTTGGLGSTSRINVVVETDTGDSFTREVSVRPGEVNIIWEAFSYTPPFYKGKALSSSASLVTLVALPEIADSQGKKIDPKKLVYTWSQSGVVLGNSSGVGKQSVILQNEVRREEPLVASVSVSLGGSSARLRDVAVVPVFEQEVLIYEKRPLEGVVYSSVLQDVYSFEQDEVIFRAEPYFFSLDDVFSGLLGYRWRVNGEDIAVPRKDQGKEITFRREGVEEGQAIVALEIVNNNIPFRIFQEAKSSFNILFE